MQLIFLVTGVHRVVEDSKLDAVDDTSIAGNDFTEIGTNAALVFLTRMIQDQGLILPVAAAQFGFFNGEICSLTSNSLADLTRIEILAPESSQDVDDLIFVHVVDYISD